MVTLREYEAYLKVKRFIDGQDESEIISRLINEINYIPLTIESNGTDPIKYYSTSAAAKYCWVTKQTLGYAHRNRCTRIVRRTLKEYEAYLKVKRFIDGHDEAEIISRLIGDNKYVPLIIESDNADLIKYYSTSAAARHCGVTKQALDYTHRNRFTRIFRRKGGVKEYRIT